MPSIISSIYYDLTFAENYRTIFTFKQTSLGDNYVAQGRL